MLLANNLKFVRDNKTIFQNINISAASGKIIFVKGRNGSGKTTLLKTLLNILTPFEGEIFWMGKKTKNNLFKLYSSTTLILDKPTSTREITLLENINFWKKISLSTIVNEGVINLLKTLDIYNYINKEVMYLSQGEVKKLELARLIIEQKKLWILDEPYNGLDKNTISLIKIHY